MVQGKEELREALLKVAEATGVEPTENFDKIVKAKERFGIGIFCPCDRNSSDRFCISSRCLHEIEKNGTCHCNCWKKGE